MNNANDKSLESWIWDAACSIRGAQEAPKFKDFILPLVFTKRLCDVFDDELNRIAEQVGSRAKAETLHPGRAVAHAVSPRKGDLQRLAAQLTGIDHLRHGLVVGADVGEEQARSGNRLRVRNNICPTVARGQGSEIEVGSIEGVAAPIRVSELDVVRSVGIVGGVGEGASADGQLAVVENAPTAVVVVLAVGDRQAAEVQNRAGEELA
jgi:hypothetical protein